MTNVDSQTTADFWDAYMTAAEADNHVPMPAQTAWEKSIGDDDHSQSTKAASSAQTALCAPRAAARCASLPEEDRCAERPDSQTGDGDGAPFVQSGDCEGEDHGDQPANGDNDDDRRRFEQDRWQDRRFRLVGGGWFGVHRSPT